MVRRKTRGKSKDVLKDIIPGSIVDPFILKDVLWPHVRFYKEQRDIIQSVWCNKETIVPAGNKLGKDFVAGFIVLAYFLTRFPCRIITTSVRDDHLRVLWGEMNRYIQEARFPLKHTDGGPLIVTHHEIRRRIRKYTYKGQCIGWEDAPLCYIRGMVSEKGEGLAGHHIAESGDGIPRTMMVVDEASSSEQEVYDQSQKWANRLFAFGNCWQTTNWWRQCIKGKIGAENENIRKGGDILNDPKDTSKGFFRKIIKIPASASPNIRRAKRQIELGQEPDGRMILPGVKGWTEYEQNLKFWSPDQIEIGLNANFYEGIQNFLYPEAWRLAAEEFAKAIENILKTQRRALGIGVDCAEGGDNTALCAVDADGVIELISEKTPDTSEIPEMVIRFMKKWRCAPENVLFDRGGGGYQHVSVMNKLGLKVRSVSFGEQAGGGDSGEKWKYFHTRRERKLEAEEKTLYKNRRAELYGVLRDIINPAYDTGFGIARKFVAIHDQMTPIPLLWDEGKLIVPPKQPKPMSKNPDDEVTLLKLIGHSPDELDALALAVFAMTHKSTKTIIRSMI